MQLDSERVVLQPAAHGRGTVFRRGHRGIELGSARSDRHLVTATARSGCKLADGCVKKREHDVCSHHAGIVVRQLLQELAVRCLVSRLRGTQHVLKIVG